MLVEERMQMRPFQFGFYFCLVVGDETRAQRETEPQPARFAIARRNSRLEQRRFHRLEEPELLGAPQATRIHRHQHVSRAALAFIADALDQRVFARFNAIDLDAGLPGEVGVQRLVSLVVARRVQVQDFVLLRHGRGGK